MLEADLKNFFGSLSHEWMLRFVEHRVGDPRLINLIRRWLSNLELSRTQQTWSAISCVSKAIVDTRHYARDPQ